MRIRETLIVTGVILASAVVLIQAQAPQSPGQPLRPPGPGSRHTQAESAEPQPTRLQIEFLKVGCTAKSLSTINLDELSAGQPPIEEVLIRLQKIGETRLATRVDNVIDLGVDGSLVQGTRVPTIQNVNVNKEGVVTPSITYEAVGTTSRVNGIWERAGDKYVVRARCSLEFSSINRTTVKGTKDVQLPEFQNFRIDQQILLQSGKPVMILSNGQSPPDDEEGRCFATIVRLTATRLDSPMPKPPAAE